MSEDFNLNDSLNDGVIKTKKRFPKIGKYLNKKYIFPGLILLAIPLTVSLALVSQELRGRASEYPATPATPPSPIETPINFYTSEVSLTAKNFYIDINGKKFMYPNSNNVTSAKVTYGTDGYYRTNIDGTWKENNTEMRLYMSFKYKPGDFWRLDEVKTYSGVPGTSWVYYRPVEVMNSLGESYINGQLDIFDNGQNTGTKAQIHFDSINMKPFLSMITPTPTLSNSKLQTSIKCNTSLSYTDVYAKELTATLVDQNGRPVASKTITWKIVYPNSSISPLISPNPATTGTTGIAYAKVSLPVGTTGSGGNTIQADFSGDTYNYPSSCQTKVSYSIIPTPSTTKVILYPNADAYVGSTAPNQNYGTTPNLKNDLNPDEISYIRFNLSSLAGKTIKSAKLVLWISDPTNSTLNLRNADDSDWSETGITYNKRPPFVSTITSFNAKTKDASVALDVTTRVNNKKGTRASFGIKAIADDSGAFYSRNAVDSTKRPQLVVEYQ